METTWWIIGAVVVVVIFWIIKTYNGLIQIRNRCDLTWSQIDVMLKKRFDLIPNLVATVKGYASHEKEVFEGVAIARSMMDNAKGVADAAEANNMLTGTLRTLFAVAEAYPELKANENFMDLQNELSDLESKIASRRQYYNDSVYSFNTAIQMFPGSLFAMIFHFTAREYFAAEEEEKKNVKVEF